MRYRATPETEAPNLHFLYEIFTFSVPRRDACDGNVTRTVHLSIIIRALFGALDTGIRPMNRESCRVLRAA
jgi:hypothetical protein